MPTENAEYIAQLVPSQPENSDFVLEGDNELRQLKKSFTISASRFGRAGYHNYCR